MAMTAAEQMPLADVKDRLAEVVDLVELEDGGLVVTKRGLRRRWSRAWRTAVLGSDRGCHGQLGRLADIAGH